MAQKGKGHLLRTILTNKWRLLGLLYSVFLLGFVLRGLFFFFYDGSCETLALPLAEAEAFEIEPGEKGGWQSLGTDPRFVFEDIDARARRVVLKGSFDRAPGEMDLYYTRDAGDDFSPSRRVLARPTEEGWEYLLPPGRYASLRLDAGTSEQNLLVAEALVLNPGQPFWHYLVPGVREALALLCLPALAAAVLSTLAAFLPPGWFWRRHTGEDDKQP